MLLFSSQRWLIVSASLGRTFRLLPLPMISLFSLEPAVGLVSSDDINRSSISIDGS